MNVYDLQLGRESLGFNESQMRAFKMAVTKRFAVIQGPPGTGKDVCWFEDCTCSFAELLALAKRRTAFTNLDGFLY